LQSNHEYSTENVSRLLRFWHLETSHSQ
jgi:hypothetical protein